VDQLFYTYVEDIDNVLLRPGCVLHCFKGIRTRVFICRFDIEIGSDFLDVRGPNTRIVIRLQHFQGAAATSVLCDVFGHGSGDTAGPNHLLFD
jgi:hypothetical protein